MPRRKADQAVIENRRAIVAANLLTGASYRDIASATGFSVGTVAGDVKALLEQWQTDQARDIEQFRALHLRRLDVLLNAIWEQATGSKPNLFALDRVLRIMERQAALQGLDKPRSIDLTMGGKQIKFIEVNKARDIIT